MLTRTRRRRRPPNPQQKPQRMRLRYNPQYWSQLGLPQPDFFLPLMGAARDFSPKGNNNGTIHGGATWQGSPGGLGLKFDGSSGYVDCGTGLVIGTNNITFGCWFINNNATSTDASMFARSVYGAAYGRYALLVNDASSNSISALFTGDKTTGVAEITQSGNSYNDGNPHLAIVVIKRTVTMTLYVDAVQVASGSISGYDFGDNLTQTYNVMVGAYNNASGGSSSPNLFWKGFILCAFEWLGSLLTQQQITKLYRDPWAMFSDPWVSFGQGGAAPVIPGFMLGGGFGGGSCFIGN